MAKWNPISSAVIACLAISSPALANSYKMNVGGSSMTCTSWRGQPVKVVANTALSTLGRASFTREGSPMIELHPGALGSHSRFVQQWWFAHECAHHELPPGLNSEKRADCLAAKKVRRLAGIASPSDARAIKRELRNLSGSELGHLPGEQRAQLVLKCAGLDNLV